VALKEAPREDHRHRIEHCCYVTPPIQRRLKELGVIDASANGFLHELGDAYKANRGEEDIKGSIEPGKLADLVVIDKDPLNIPNDDLKNVETVMTIIDGKIVYRRR
jgi:predicted amidohydrolase YtcJ